ncbi:MAG: hypothetical protein IKY62_02340 [Clostridia bacterium]|nr:hypothetical protein [Clostridia bacterium]
MEEKICSFFGHRELKITDELYSRTACEITRAIEDGCHTFYFGGYGKFDELCYNIVAKMKEEKPEIKRIYCVAQERYLHKNVPYFKRENYDDVIYLTPTFDYWYKSIYYRNCAMIDKSDIIIFCAEKRESSGAYKAYKYAKRKKGKCIVNLY